MSRATVEPNAQNAADMIATKLAGGNTSITLAKAETFRALERESVTYKAYESAWKTATSHTCGDHVPSRQRLRRLVLEAAAQGLTGVDY